MAAARKKVVVLALSRVDRDARVQRQVACLAQDHELTVVGHGELGAAALPHVGMRQVPPRWPAPIHYPLVLATAAAGHVAARAAYDAWSSARRDHRAALAAAIASAPDVIVANDWYTLPIAVRAARRTGARIVADLHEYAPLQFEQRAAWRLLIAPLVDHHLRAAAPHLAAAITVNDAIADRYAREYGIACEVVRNVPAARPPASARATDPQAIRIVHHGNATRDRKLELVIEALARTDQRFSLHLRLIPIDRGYLNWLRALAARTAPGRVQFEPPMQPERIVPTLAGYDLGIHVLPPLSFNHRVALPNKFFEFMFAGLAICVGPSPEMARVVHEHGCGVVVPSFDPVDVAEHLGRLSATDIDAMKRRSIAACAHFMPEHEMRVLRDVVARVAGAR